MDEPTKIHIECPILNFAVALEDNKLPTIIEVLQYFEWIRFKMLSKNKFNPSVKVIIAKIVEDLKLIWAKSQIPVVTDAAIIKLLHVKINALIALRKLINVRPEKNMKLKNDIEKFSNEISNLLCLTACKCKLIDQCNCNEKSKIPETRLDFLQDQKTCRNQTISSLPVFEELIVIDLDADKSLSETINLDTDEPSPHIALIDNEKPQEPPFKKRRKDNESQNDKHSKVSQLSFSVLLSKFTPILSNI